MTDLASDARSAGRTAPIIELIGVNKWFDDFQALKDINLAVLPGEKLVVCGPSGSGKSTMIRCINRLERHQSGRIIVDGTELDDDEKNIRTVRQEVGMVFQQFNLFPHLTVLENLMIGPQRARKMTKAQARERAELYLERVHIPEQADKYPSQLSGGQQQRMTMVCVPHEMGFAKRVADTMVFMDAGEIVESADPETFFGNPRTDRCQRFLQQILGH